MCGGPKWKREVVQDHKFDFISVADFRDNGFKMRSKYIFLFLIFFKSFAVYMSDIFTAITMLTTKNWSNQIFNECTDKSTGCVFIPFNTGKWLFVGCIIFSFLLVHDISYAFTNVLANNYYSLRSYDHFCFFDHISNSTKLSDDFAFFVFFVFKSWKRVLLADGPRQTINALTLYSLWLVKHDKAGWDISKYFVNNSISTSLLTVTHVLHGRRVSSAPLVSSSVAGICYIPLLCYIRGNLKAQQEGPVHLETSPPADIANLSVDDDIDDKSSMHTKVAPSTYTQDSYYYYNSDAKNANPPPMPAYNPYSTHQAPDAYANFNPSQATFQQSEDPYQYEDESNAHLTSGAAPFSQQYTTDRHGSPAPFSPISQQPRRPKRVSCPRSISQPRRSKRVSCPHSISQPRRPKRVPRTQSVQFPCTPARLPCSKPVRAEELRPARRVSGPGSASPRPQQAPSALGRPVSGLAYDDADAYGGYSASPQQQQYPTQGQQQYPTQGQQQPNSQGMWNPGRDIERGGGAGY
ncbi:hypothetical protein B0H14DRAFT_2935855 [Mycena olivaceomarginata]|nr:hypothetical protein B0H14DRAFT_2935855 [Mycena olivaceomarginata]